MKDTYLVIAFLLFSLAGFSQVPARHPKGVAFHDITGDASDPATLELTGNKAVIYWNSTLGKFRKWNGLVWSDLILPAGVGNIFEAELTDAQNNIDVGFNLTPTSLVYYNGKIVPNNRWSGEGTQILNVSLDTKQYDKITVKN